MSDNDQKTPQSNAPSTEEGIKLGREYDENRAKAAEDRANDDGKSLGDGRVEVGGAVVTGSGSPLGTETLFPGAKDRFDGVEDATQGGQAVRASKGLDTDDVTVEDSTWTAQSAHPYVSANAGDVPGQTFTPDELPDPEVVDASPLPAHAIPANLVVDSARTDDISPSQERGGDAGTAATAPHNPSVDPAAEAADARVGGRAAGRSKGKA